MFTTTKNKLPTKRLLLTPGPMDIAFDVKKALMRRVVHHRTDEFKQLFGSFNKKLQKVFFTKNPVLTLHCVGTGAMEASMVNLVLPDDKILILKNGVFSKRWVSIADAYGFKYDVLEFPYGSAINTDTLKKTLIKNGKKYKAVFLNHVETSTGVLNNVEEIARIIKKYSNAFIVLDAMASVGAEKLYIDKWGIDIAFTSSCKALGNIAGLSFIAVSHKALNFIKKHKTKSFYFDFDRIYRYYKDNQTPFTCSSGLIYAQDRALDRIIKKGIKKVWGETKIRAEYFRNIMSKSGLKLFAENPANALTAIKINRADSIVNLMRKKFGITIANGQECLKGKIIRISHMGSVSKKDLYVTFKALIAVFGGNR